MKFNIKSHLYTNNWFTFEKFYKEVAYDPNIFTAVEVGVFKGFSISYLVREMIKAGKKDFRVWAVDVWEDWKSSTLPEQPYIYEIYNFILNRNGVRDYIVDIKRESHLAAKMFNDNSLDFVFIDADHDAFNVNRDIVSWASKVKKGMVLAGHDYYLNDSNGNDVKAAVDELDKNGFFPNGFEIREGNIWIARM
ncbi:MAG: class I SAM-dependent methyltransferase [Bacteroidales bacterium]|nr:class I SAM-dependent methyltransferase [Bacteroidales bacterium]